ncbi:MAG: hypothetical protein LBQ34_05065 [Alphaproteobacteria bacterium]|jgi:hypothetical protein|nr:hypothetical protein [Alphaproteobacteria bacterium]
MKKLMMLFVLLLVGACASNQKHVATFEKTGSISEPNTFRLFVNESNRNDAELKEYVDRIVSNFEEIGFTQNINNPRYNIHILFTQDASLENHRLGLLLSIVDTKNKNASFKFKGFVVDREITSKDYLCLIDSLFSRDVKTHAISFDSLTTESFDKGDGYPC